jgi:putative PIN family toxin of toxin-antitoxin system
VTKVVFDANVYISALVFGGAPQRLLDVITSQKVSLYISQSIMDEVEGVLLRKFGWTRAETTRFLPPLWARCIMIKPAMGLAVSPDPDDNHVLECAQAARADFLITGNPKHFPRAHNDTKIISVRQLLDLLLPAGDEI